MGSGLTIPSGGGGLTDKSSNFFIIIIIILQRGSNCFGGGGWRFITLSLWEPTVLVTFLVGSGNAILSLDPIMGRRGDKTD